MEKGIGSKTTKIKAKLLSTYYGNPAKDMKLIIITGTTGKTIVAHYVHEILRAAGEQVAVLASDQPFKISMLHKFLNDAWKAGANYVIITSPVQTIRKNTFFNLPIYVAAMTDFLTASLTDMTPEEYIESEKILFNMQPKIVILNRSDLNYDAFAAFKGTEKTLTYGQPSGDIKILKSKLYKKGSEATLSLSPEIINVATFVPGETAVSYMAAAAAIARSIGVKTDNIIDGIANYDPEA